MKKLLLTSILALSFALPLNAFAGNSIFGVSTPIENNQVNSNVAGGYVAEDLSDTFNIQKLHNQKSVIKDLESGESYYVFGVDLSDLNQI